MLVSARGAAFTQSHARRYAEASELTLLCGHYKDVDQRVADHLATEEVSLGPFVLSGGEPAALAIVDATVRLLPGAMSDLESAYTDSHWEDGLSAPSYTRPPEYRGLHGAGRAPFRRPRPHRRVAAGRGCPAHRAEARRVVSLTSVNPATGEVLARIESHAAGEVEARVAKAHDAWHRWRATTFAERAAILTRAAGILENERSDLGRLMTREMGKPIKAAMEEAAKCALGCRYYAMNAERHLARRNVSTEDKESFVLHQPIGVVLAIMPWNFPFWQVFRFAAPALMAGNVGLLKHASNVPQCALAIEDVLRRAGAPEGTFQTLLVGPDAVGALISDPRIAAVTLTGSEAAGRDVGARAGREIKTSVLELGGSDAFVVMPSAPLDHAVATAVRARTVNNGQSCIAAKRFIVHEAIFDEFARRFTAQIRSLRVGDPLDESYRDRPARDGKDSRGARRPGASYRERRRAHPDGRPAARASRKFLRAHRPHGCPG